MSLNDWWERLWKTAVNTQGPEDLMSTLWTYQDFDDFVW